MIIQLGPAHPCFTFHHPDMSGKSLYSSLAFTLEYFSSDFINTSLDLPPYFPDLPSFFPEFQNLPANSSPVIQTETNGDETPRVSFAEDCAHTSNSSPSPPSSPSSSPNPVCFPGKKARKFQGEPSSPSHNAASQPIPPSIPASSQSSCCSAAALSIWCTFWTFSPNVL